MWESESSQKPIPLSYAGLGLARSDRAEQLWLYGAVLNHAVGEEFDQRHKPSGGLSRLIFGRVCGEKRLKMCLNWLKNHSNLQ